MKNLETFNSQGYIHLKNVIPPNLLEIAQSETLHMKVKLLEYNLIGTPRNDAGTGQWWGGIEMASNLNGYLKKCYTDNFMYDIASYYLDTTDVYLFNDQVVVKLPNEPFEFHEHFDNQYGPDLGQAQNGVYKTINFSWILDDFTDDSGTLELKNTTTGEWDKIYPNAGDIVGIEGNTLHRSSKNISNDPRRLYACVYSNKNIGDFHRNPSHPLPNFRGFYTEKFNKNLTIS